MHQHFSANKDTKNTEWKYYKTQNVFEKCYILFEQSLFTLLKAVSV